MNESDKAGTLMNAVREGKELHQNLVTSEQLAKILTEDSPKYLIVDCRRFFAYNMSRVQNSINVCCSKLILRRMYENKISAVDYLLGQWLGSEYEQILKRTQSDDALKVILYGEAKFIGSAEAEFAGPTAGNNNVNASFGSGKAAQMCSSAPIVRNFNGNNQKAACGPGAGAASTNSLETSLIEILTKKLATCNVFNKAFVLKDGFLDFCSKYPQFCEGVDSADNNNENPNAVSPQFVTANSTPTCMSQPCQSILNQGPTKILPFVYLGSQQDSLNKDLLRKHGINYIINMSIGCPKPEFLQEEHFLRIPVNDNNTEKLLPYFERAFQFLDKVRKANGIVLVHCLAGVSRSPTLAIAYVMNYLRMSQADAYKFVKEKRPNISPNFNFLGQLLEYENRLNLARLQQKQEHEEKQQQIKENSASTILLHVQSQNSFPGTTGPDCCLISNNSSHATYSDRGGEMYSAAIETGENFNSGAETFLSSSEVKNAYRKRKLVPSKPSFKPLLLTSRGNSLEIGACETPPCFYTAPVMNLQPQRASPFKFPTLERSNTTTMGGGALAKMGLITMDKVSASIAENSSDLPSPGLGLSKLNMQPQQLSSPFVSGNKTTGSHPALSGKMDKNRLVGHKANQSGIVLFVKSSLEEISDSLKVTSTSSATNAAYNNSSSVITASQPNLAEEFYKMAGTKRRSWPRSLSHLAENLSDCEIYQQQQSDESVGSSDIVVSFTATASSHQKHHQCDMPPVISDFDLPLTAGRRSASNAGSRYSSNSSLEIMVT